jgi:hypothetical protein
VRKKRKIDSFFISYEKNRKRDVGREGYAELHNKTKAGMFRFSNED